jgi:hypothetical protein
MHNELFNLLISNQQKWSDEYKIQEHRAAELQRKRVKDKNYYGNSKEYKRALYQFQRGIFSAESNNPSQNQNK